MGGLKIAGKLLPAAMAGRENRPGAKLGDN